MALVCFSYGVGAMFYEQHNGTRGIEGDAFFDTKLENFGAKLKTAGDVSVELKIEALRKMVEESRAVRLESVSNSLQTIPKEEFKHTEEERFLKMTLRTVEGKNFCGQIVEESGRLCYASVFARNSYLSRN